MNRKLTALLGAAAAVTSWGFAAPAMAATAHPAAAGSGGYAVQQVNPTTYISPLSKTLTKEPLEGSWIIRTRSCNSTCYELTSQGNGLDMTIQSTGFSTFNQSNPGGSRGTIWITPNGYCVHGTTLNIVISSTNCGPGNTASQWVENGSGELTNVDYAGGLLGVDGLANGETALIEPFTGAYYLEPVNIG